ncbi:MAG: ISL3 family transposase [bacterium]|nr:ISL3 family transposase [bacterium]
MRASTLLRVLLAIQHLVVRGFHFDPAGLVVDVTPRHRSIRCGECGGKARRVKDRRVRRWRHLDLAGMMVHLRYAIRRVHCDACGTVKTEQVPWSAPGSNFTHAFEERTAYLAQQSSSTAVSKLLRVTWRTVGRIIRRVVQRGLDASGDRLDGLAHIGIDELSYRRHHEYVTVVVDHERGVVVWSSKGKNAETLQAFFEDLGPERCAAIESVTIDMSQAYISVVKDKIPHACLVFDRFHVQRLVQDALDETRRDEVRAAATKEDKKSLNSTRWSLLKSPWNLTDADHQTLEQLEDANRSIFCGYLLKESFAGILDRRQINVARCMLRQWIAGAKKSGLDHFARAARTIDRHQDGILEYVRTRFSNARTEGLNGKIRTITRRAFGFHSATALISMIFLCCGGVHVTPAFSAPEGFH